MYVAAVIVLVFGRYSINKYIFKLRYNLHIITYRCEVGI